MRYIATLITLAALAACTSSSGPNVALNQEFTLGVGGEADIEGTSLSLRFIRVVTDSRCPANVECIWAGNAQIALETINGSARGTAALNTFDGAREIAVGQFRDSLVSLVPVPVDPGTIESGDYRATLRVIAVSGQVCTADARPALSVSVVDSVTGAVDFTNVRAIARDGEFADTVFQATLPGPIFVNALPLAYERAGTYAVTVTADGYLPWTRSGIEVDSDPCHVLTVPVTARLAH
jgi:hypothetical protein